MTRTKDPSRPLTSPLAEMVPVRTTETRAWRRDRTCHMSGQHLYRCPLGTRLKCQPVTPCVHTSYTLGGERQHSCPIDTVHREADKDCLPGNSSSSTRRFLTSFLTSICEARVWSNYVIAYMQKGRKCPGKKRKENSSSTCKCVEAWTEVLETG